MVFHLDFIVTLWPTCRGNMMCEDFCLSRFSFLKKISFHDLKVGKCPCWPSHTVSACPTIGLYNFGCLPSTPPSCERRLAALSSSLSHLPPDNVFPGSLPLRTRVEQRARWLLTGKLMLQRSYFKDDAPVIFPSPATFLQRCHGYIKGFPAVTVGKMSIPLTVSLLEKQRRSKNTCSEQLLDAAKTVVELHLMTLYFQSSLLLPTSAVPPQKRKSAALTSCPTEEHGASHTEMKEDLWRAVGSRSLQGQCLSMRILSGQWSWSFRHFFPLCSGRHKRPLARRFGGRAKCSDHSSLHNVRPLVISLRGTAAVATDSR